MSYSATILTDSLAPSNVRLTTALVTMPRMILCEITRHRMFSFSVASSRAIPTLRLLKQVHEHPFVPGEFAANQRGMQAGEALGYSETEEARRLWLAARDAAARVAGSLSQMEVHKQWVNRLVEPFLWTTVLMTGVASAWANFFWLRCHDDAQPELRHAAEMLRDAYFASEPEEVSSGEWHLPFVVAAVRPGELDAALAASVARCARVSYERHDAPPSPEADLALTDRLRSAGHWSPFEHQAQAIGDDLEWSGNLRGWRQLRHMFLGESVTDLEKVRPKNDEH